MIRNRLYSYLLLVLSALFVAACQGAVSPPVEDIPETPELVAAGDGEELPPATATSPSATATATVPPAQTATSPPPATATATPPPQPTDPPTATATTRPLPPLVVNGTQPQGTAPVIAELTYDPDYLFRIDARRTSMPDVPGGGIAQLDFVISSSTVAELYTHTEQNVGYCIFGGGEPDCNPWPLVDGVYRWGEGGPPVEPGQYYVQVVFHFTPESDDGSGIDEAFWSFEFELAAP